MSLDRQINLFRVDTNAFLLPEEKNEYAKIMNIYQEWAKKRNGRKPVSWNKLKNKLPVELNEDEQLDMEYYIKVKHEKAEWKSYILSHAKEIAETPINERSSLRELDRDYLFYKDKEGVEHPNKKRIVGMFESSLSRSFGIKTDDLTYDIFILEIYYYDIARDLILNGFNYDGRHYIYFSSSAGQIRTKKAVFVEETKYRECQNKLMCGLTIDEINSRGGMNVNKYLAYIALCNSATDLWEDVLGRKFDIDRCVVVDDFETMVDCKVDHIDYQTYEIECNKQEKIPIPHTDGCGMILPEISTKNFMVRLPFIKGLLGVFDFKKFILKNKSSSKIKDIWGKEYDIFKDNIEVILTKSQLKMYKFFDSWDHYKGNFIKYECEAGICNLEEDRIPNARINYQMLQTLHDMSNKEIKELCSISNNRIQNVSNTLANALGFYGVSLAYDRKDASPFQKALRLYPELINDPAARNDLRELRKSYVKKYRGGKLEVVGKFTFVLPDLYAFCEWLFMGEEIPRGLLKNNEVFCRLYPTAKELDCLRSPHLYIEHCVRKNVCSKEEVGEWFVTDAIYTSTYDPISKVLQFDVDGDRLLVLAQKQLIEIAKRCSKSTNPLYYEMKKANAELINPENIYNGLKLAFTGGRIGGISNNITKIWNSGEITEEALMAVKWLCMETNFTIDYAKTLFKPTRPGAVNEIIKSYTRNKVPYFFIYAKDKKYGQVMPTNNCMMNVITREIKNPRQNLKTIKNLGDVDCNVLMHGKALSSHADELIKVFNDSNKRYGYNLNIDEESHDKNNYPTICQEIRRSLNRIEPDLDKIVNTLVTHMYMTPNTRKKNLLWFMYGDEILHNIQENVSDLHVCSCCGKRTAEELINGKCKECRDKELQCKGTKTISCIDCGREIEVNKKDTKTCRCEECRKAKKDYDHRIRQKRYLEKNDATKNESKSSESA